jgi:Response regulator of the LytR/AlgR family
MNNPFFDSVQLRFLYGSIWIFIITVQILLVQYFTPFRIDIIICDSLITNLLQSLSLLLLWYPVRYYRNIFNIPLFLLFHIFLLVLSVGIWLGLGYIITSLFIEHTYLYTNYYLNILPLRIAWGLLIYIIFVLIYYLFILKSKVEEKQKKIDESLMETATNFREKLSRVCVKKRNVLQFVSVEKICYLEANGDYVFIYTEKERYLKDKTMKYWEAHLPEANFVRIHRSFIVNIDYIRGLELYEKESYKVRMKNEIMLRVSNNGYKLLKQKMN